jgi:hypothetical protein
MSELKANFSVASSVPMMKSEVFGVGSANVVSNRRASRPANMRRKRKYAVQLFLCYMSEAVFKRSQLCYSNTTQWATVSAKRRFTSVASSV